MNGERALGWLSIALLVGLLGLMLATFGDYGMTADEPVQNRYGNRLLRWYATFGADRSAVEQHDTYYYGGLFELVAQAAVRLSPLGTYEDRHLVNALAGFVGIVASWWLGAQLAGPLGGLLAAAFLAATPLFYGHAFNNPKDVPFASLYALATAALVNLKLDRLPGTDRRALAGLAGAGAAIGLAAAVRVAGLTLLGSAAAAWVACLVAGRVPRPRRAAAAPLRRDLGRLALGVALLTAAAWLVMLAFWPYAQLDPVRHPLAALRAFSDFWQSMPVFYDGALVSAGQVSRFYMPWLFAVTLPEFHLVAWAMGAWRALAVLRGRPLSPQARSRLVHIVWLLAVTALPLAWVVLAHTPFYNGNRHLLFIVPGLAAIAGVAAASWLRSPLPSLVRAAGAVLLAATVALAVEDMVELHPYQSVYFNRLVGGGLARAGRLYETDYWCATYKEGIDWIVGAYSRPGLRERVRVAGHSTLVQVEYDLERDEQRRSRFHPVTIHEDPHLVLATTATGDHERTPGRVVHVVERQGFPLLYVFELRAPR